MALYSYDKSNEEKIKRIKVNKINLKKEEARAKSEMNKQHKKSLKIWFKDTEDLQNTATYHEKIDAAYEKYSSVTDKAWDLQEAKLQEIENARTAMENLVKLKKGLIVPESKIFSLPEKDPAYNKKNIFQVFT